MPNYHIRIANDDLTFSVGHFITFEDGTCEQLHGHTYHVTAELSGPLNQNGYVADYLAVGDMLKEIIVEIDHRIILPTGNPAIRIAVRQGQIEVTWGERRWTFPQDGCLLLPLANTTTELLAQYIGEQLTASLKTLDLVPDLLRIEVSESSGFSAVCELP